jgi:HK97 gp10 family phage protein
MAGIRTNASGSLEWFGDEVIKKVKAAKVPALTAACKLVQSTAKPLAPVKEGELRASIVYKVSGEEGRIGTNVDYAPHVEYGTKAHEIKVKNAKVLTDGKSFFGKTVNHPGTTAQPFMRPALDNNRKNIEKLIGEFIGKVIVGGGKK